MFKKMDKKFSQNLTEYNQRRHDRVSAMFPRFCPHCESKMNFDYCTQCGTEVVFPMYCTNCDILVNQEVCPYCGGEIYIHRIKSRVEAKDFTFYPN